ncbi:hypothetical protein B9Z19DRAFT_1017037 [Tuber borchii]|uniref:Uncharacterized protein n=1 Tax=Tuber borchii TaxID=42251 RepID=A0A2T7A4J8_TUBBO|nr:hypothetical protein B9Z19DRAFT_1017037 [Tuber borchii]
MAPIPVQKADISETPSQPPQRDDSGSGSAGNLPSPQDRAPLGVGRYLTEGLPGVEAQHYRGTQSFMTAINSQTDQLRSGNAGQYAVFSKVTQHQFEKLERFRDTHCKSLRFLYYENEETLIVKIMPGPAHEVACTQFELELVLKLVKMGLHYELINMRSTTYQGIGCKKEADCAFRPLSSRPHRTDWPTFIVECGVSESIKKLRRDCTWWFENSAAQVKTVLLFAVSEKTKKIHIEQWEMCTEPKCIRTIDIVEADAAGASLRLSFQNLFLREPGKDEVDIIFSTEDLERFAANVWRSTASRPPGGAPTGLTSRASGAGLSSCWESASVLYERLRSKLVTGGHYSPLLISHSPTLLPVFTRPLQFSPMAWRGYRLPPGPVNCLKGPHITCSRPTCGVTMKNQPSKIPVIPIHQSQSVIRLDAKIPVPQGRPFRYWALANTAYVCWPLLAVHLQDSLPSQVHPKVHSR